MKKAFGRREFLKLLAVLPPGVLLSNLARKAAPSLQGAGLKSVLIVVFDALSARNMALYGYPRQTMPNLARLAERATVYHDHHAGGNFTTPGVATLLTGTYPWTHRAVRLGGNVVADKLTRNVFNLFESYYRIGYSHNNFVNIHFHSMKNDLNHIKPQKDLFVRNDLALDRLFPWESDIANLAWERAMKKAGRGYAYSLFLSQIYEHYRRREAEKLNAIFPKGIPRIGEDDYFLLEEGINWLQSELAGVEEPFFGYFHFLPPHHPYSPRRDYVDAFKADGVGYFKDKPQHPFFSQAGDRDVSLQAQSLQRQLYDEFLLYADGELGRLLDSFEQSALNENTWIVFTSDHGELFERGIFGHHTPVLYEPVLHVPLLICEPGQTARRDVYTRTSAVDVLPTLLKVTGREIPEWVEGVVLPPFSDDPPAADRSIFAVEAKSSKVGEALVPATTIMVKGRYKLMHFFGYEALGEMGHYFELYDLESDPDEMNNLYEARPEIALPLLVELLDKLRQAEEPYRMSG